LGMVAHNLLFRSAVDTVAGVRYDWDIGRYCEGFRTTAIATVRRGTGAVVRKRPGKEPAGS